MPQTRKRVEPISSQLPSSLPPSDSGLPQLPLQDRSVPPPDPRIERIRQLMAQAQGMEQQAAPQQVQPQGVKQNIVAGLSSIGQAGGYGGMMAQRQAIERQRQQDLYERANALRQRGVQEETGMETARLHGIEEQRYNQEVEARKAETARRAAKDAEPTFSHFGTAGGGEKFGSVDKGVFTQQGEIAPATKAAPVESVDEQGLKDWMSKNPGKGPSDYVAAKATMGQRPQNQVLWGDDPDNPGKQAPFEYDPATKTLTKVSVQRTPTAIVTGETKKTEANKGIIQSISALEKLAKQNTYIADVAMADQFFNVVKPDSGARMNQSYIDRLMRPGPLKNRMSVWAKQLDQGQMLTAQDRQYMIDAAHAIGESKTESNAPTGAVGQSDGQPKTMILNGKTLTLGADGKYH